MLKFVYDIGYKSRTLANPVQWRPSWPVISAVNERKNFKLFFRFDPFEKKFEFETTGFKLNWKRHISSKKEKEKGRGIQWDRVLCQKWQWLWNQLLGGGRHSSADPTELHSCGPSSNSKYNIYAFLNLYSNCDPNRTKINKKRHF